MEILIRLLLRNSLIRVFTVCRGYSAPILRFNIIFSISHRSKEFSVRGSISGRYCYEQRSDLFRKGLHLIIIVQAPDKGRLDCNSGISFALPTTTECQATFHFGWHQLWNILLSGFLVSLVL